MTSWRVSNESWNCCCHSKRISLIKKTLSGDIIISLPITESAGYSPGWIYPDSLEVFYATELLRQEYLTQQGDIIIRLSVPYTAILIDPDMTGMVVSSNFAIIRLNQKYMLPEYLLWLLNTPDIKRKIYENSSSNMLSAVRPTFFAELEVLLLPLADQKKIAKLNLLAKQEIQLLKKLADEKERYYVAVIEHAQKNMRRKIHDDQKRY